MQIEIYSDFKTLGDRWLQSWIFTQKRGRKKMEFFFFQFFRVNTSEKTQLFKLYMKKSQDVHMCYVIAYAIYILRSF